MMIMMWTESESVHCGALWSAPLAHKSDFLLGTQRHGEQQCIILLCHIERLLMGLQNKGTRAQPHRRKAQGCGGKDFTEDGHN